METERVEREIERDRETETDRQTDRERNRERETKRQKGRRWKETESQTDSEKETDRKTQTVRGQTDGHRQRKKENIKPDEIILWESGRQNHYRSKQNSECTCQGLVCCGLPHCSLGPDVQRSQTQESLKVEVVASLPQMDVDPQAKGAKEALAFVASYPHGARRWRLNGIRNRCCLPRDPWFTNHLQRHRTICADPEYDVPLAVFLCGLIVMVPGVTMTTLSERSAEFDVLWRPAP